MTSNKVSNNKAYNYFNNYPLLSSKFLDFKDWSYILTLQNFSNSTSSYLDQAIKIRTDYNKTRTTFVFSHLINNSYFNS